MPAATTHLECSKDIYEQLDKHIKSKISNINLYYLGAQGPDIFFFEKFGLGNKLKRIGNYMHQYQIYPIIKYMEGYTKDIDPDLYSYFCGYLTHYALDSYAHPIVYNRSVYGNLGNDPELTIHFRIEAFYDKYVLNQKNRDITSFDTDKSLTISKNDALKLAKMYQQLFKDLLNQDIKIKSLTNTFNHIPKVLSFLKPNSYLKYKLLFLIEKLIMPNHLATSLMLYHDFGKNNDFVLNSNNEAFINVKDSNIIYTDSFDQLYSKGITKAKRIIANPLNKDEYQLDFEGNPLSPEINFKYYKS